MMSDYSAVLNQQYWAYQEAFFPDWRRYFERPSAHDGRPPVFLPAKAQHNVIVNPQASRQEASRLMAYIPDSERHKWFRSMNSSQALALSVFGNLAIGGHFSCLSELQDDHGAPLLGQAHVSAHSFTMEYPVTVLGEPIPTRIDAFFSGVYRVGIECKFSEREVGSCSRPRLTLGDSNYARDCCNGNYVLRVGGTERCPLTARGIRYWRYVPSLFKWANDQDAFPCPLNRNYQFVRNILAVGVDLEGSGSRHNGHVVLVYDERNPAFQEGGIGFAAFRETRSALHEPAMLRRCSWQRIIQHLRQRRVAPWLTEQLTRKYGF